MQWIHYNEEPVRRIDEAAATRMDRIYGKHSVRAVLLARPRDSKRLVLAGKQEYFDDLIALARGAGIEPELVPWKNFRRIGGFTDSEKHQGVCLFAKHRKILSDNHFDTLRKAQLVVILDQISNPQNLATILRSAAFFGFDAVITLRNRSVGVTPEVVRYSVGGAEFVDIFKVTNLARIVERLQDVGFWTYGLDERGTQTLAETTFADKSALVVGAEGQGLRRLTREKCDFLVRIPGGRRGVESLNAAVAATIAMAEVSR